MSEKSSENLEKITRAREDEKLLTEDLSVAKSAKSLTYATEEVNAASSYKNGMMMATRKHLEAGTPEYDQLLKNARHLSNRRRQIELAETEARHDKLTGLLNRRGFAERLSEEYKASIRYKHNLAVVMMDADGLKLVNDSFGHPAGDNALIEFADVLKSSFRDTDILCRWGGDEFAIILRETNQNTLVNILHRFRKSLEDKHIKAGNKNELTTSIGVAYLYKNNDSIEALLSRADEALYEIKQNGRNSIKIAYKDVHGKTQFRDVLK